MYFLYFPENSIKHRSPYQVYYPPLPLILFHLFFLLVRSVHEIENQDNRSVEHVTRAVTKEKTLVSQVLVVATVTASFQRKTLAPQNLHVNRMF
jgi:hypothetical protein